MRYNRRSDIIVSATKVRLQYCVVVISQFSDKNCSIAQHYPPRKHSAHIPDDCFVLCLSLDSSRRTFSPLSTPVAARGLLRGVSSPDKCTTSEQWRCISIHDRPTSLQYDTVILVSVAGLVLCIRTTGPLVN